MRKELGNIIKKQREKKNLKKEQLAKKLNISIHYVNHLESEARAAIFSESLMNRVVKVLDIPPRKATKLAAAHNKRVKAYRKSLMAA